MRKDLTLRCVLMASVLALTGGFSSALAEDVCKIGDTKYSSLADAIGAVKSGETITLLKSTDEATAITTTAAAADTFTIDLKGYSYTNTLSLTNNRVIFVGSSAAQSGSFKFTSISSASGKTVVIPSSGKYSAACSGNMNIGKSGASIILTTDGLAFDNSSNVLITDGSTVTLSGSGFGADKTFMIMNSVSEKNEKPHNGHTLILDDADDFQTFAIYVNGGSQFNVTNGTKGAKITNTGEGDGYLNVYGGTVTIDATSELKATTLNITGTVNIDGRLESCVINNYAGTTGNKGGEFIVNNGGIWHNLYGIAIGEKTKDGDKYYIYGDETAKITLVGGTVTSDESIINNGSITMNGASRISTKTFTNRDKGVITVDMTGAASSRITLIDADASSTSTYGTEGTNYKFADGRSNGFIFKVEDNDLIAERAFLPVTVTSAGYATFYSDCKLVVPDGVQVFGYTFESGTKTLIPTEVPTGAVLPANQGYVIKAAPGTYDFKVSSDEAGSHGSVLKGVVSDTPTSSITGGTIYVLGVIDGKLTFYIYTGDTMPAGKAYFIK